MFFAIEFLDEFVFGVREAAWPAIRIDLGLSYAAVGMLLTVPTLVSGLLEPLLGLLADSGRRRVLVVAGGAAFAVALVVVAAAGNPAVLLGGFAMLYPASGAFVSLSQATLMDGAPARREHNMARWVLAGSVGAVAGPLIFSAATWLGWGWRQVFFAMAVLTVPMVLRSGSMPHHPANDARSLRASAGHAWAALRNLRVLRWLLVLEVADLLGDVLAGFLAIYFVDVVGVSITVSAFAVIVWTLAGLTGDALLVPLLNRMSGLRYLRVGALLATIVYPAFLLAPAPAVKLVLVAALGVLRSGWYAIPQGRLYAELHGSSGVAVAVSNVATLTAGMIPLVIGVLAGHVGLGGALWLCALAPPVLLLTLSVGCPFNEPSVRIEATRGR